MASHDKCPLCGSEGALAFISFECSNTHCKNFHTSQKRADPDPEPDTHDDDDNYWMYGFGGPG